MLDDITATLSSIHEHGTFASRETTSYEDLRIEVKDVGNIRLPVSPTAARKLRRVGRPARFGWRDKTLLDKSVRDTWEIARSRVKIDQRSWKKILEPQLEKIKHKLVLPVEGKLVAQLLCGALGQFLTNRDQTRLEWPLAQDKRAHIHQQLDDYVLPVSHTTKRTSRPYTLILTKAKTLFEREAELRKSLKRDLT